MWIARISRPGAIDDAPAAARTFTEGEMIDREDEKEELSKIEEKESLPKVITNGLEHMPGLQDFLAGNQSSANKENLLTGIKDRRV